MSKMPQQPQDKYVLRMPDGMRDRLKDAALEKNRSMNAEIVHRLEHSFLNWPQVNLPKEAVERAFLGVPQERYVFERDLSVFAQQLLDRYFPPAGYYRDKIRSSIDNYFDQIPHENREALRKKMTDMIESFFKEQGIEEPRDGYGRRLIGGDTEK